MVDKYDVYSLTFFDIVIAETVLEESAKIREMDFFGSFHASKRVKNGRFNTSDGLFWVVSPFFGVVGYARGTDARQ